MIAYAIFKYEEFAANHRNRIVAGIARVRFLVFRPGSRGVLVFGWHNCGFLRRCYRWIILVDVLH